MTEDKKLNSNFIIDFIQNGVVAVCETLQEALYAWENGASGILLVKGRGGEFDDVFIMPDENLISQVVDEIDVPVFVRVKFGHFGEAKICEELGADGILESYKNKKSLNKKLNEDEFDFPIISEVFDIEKIGNSNKNILLLGNYATGDFNSIKKNFLKCEKIFLKNKKIFSEEKNIFLGGGISSVADLDVLGKIGKTKGFFIGSAIFDLDSKDFFQDFWEYKKNVFN